jgi:hypothetical protein
MTPRTAIYVALVGLVIAVLGWGSLYLDIIDIGFMPGLFGFIVMVVGLTMAGTSWFRLGAWRRKFEVC